jgi:anthranilate synthase component 1
LPKENSNTIPDVYYAVYQNIIAINHFQNEAYIFCHSLDGKITFQKSSNYYNLEITSYKFSKEGEGFSNLTDEEFKHNVALAKNIVFVVMYFNWFYHEGLPKALKDEFNVYRAV